MKKIVVIAIMIISSAFTFGQIIMPIDSITNKIAYQDVIELPNHTAEQLYLKSKEWFSGTFVSGKNVIDLDDSKGFKIIGKGTINILFKNGLGNVGDGGNVAFKISLFFKDNRYKYIVTDFVHVASPGMTVKTAIGGNLENEHPDCGRTLPMKYWAIVHEDTKIQINKLVLSLKNFMASKNTSDGW